MEMLADHPAQFGESMKRPPDPLPGWTASLPVALLFGSVALRAVLTYRDSPELSFVAAQLAAWLVLLLAEPAISRRWQWLFIPYLAVQAAPVLLMIGAPGLGNNDFVAVLLAILSMQAMRRLPPRHGAVIIAVLSLLMAVRIVRLYGPGEGAASSLVYTAANVFLGSYALATRRAEEARAQNENLARRVEDANRQLREASSQREQLAAARARQGLARDLHDSVTQTVFSMTLATESALMLLERDPGRVEAQLDHLARLAQNALEQMQTLISELRPERLIGLAQALRRHLAERTLPDSLAIEERGLFAIAREALNNIIKHARASRSLIRLHLSEPCWMEVTDDGQGFVVGTAAMRGGVGLAGMGERAAEIGWDLEIGSSPGEGTRIRVIRKARQERSA